MIERIETAKNVLITSAETASRSLRFVFSLGKVFASACKPKRIAGEKVKPKVKGISRLLTKAAIAIAGVFFAGSGGSESIFILCLWTYFFRNLLCLALCFILLGFWYLIRLGPPFLTLLFPL